MTRRAGKRRAPLELRLQGLHAAPSQVWGSIRLVPLIRDVPLTDLRLCGVEYGDDGPHAAIVDGTPEDPSIFYGAYIPYGMVMSWTDDGTPVASADTWLGPAEHARNVGKTRPVPILHRMVKRTSRTSFRMLPLHLAMEGFLSLYFDGPEIAWPTWSKKALRTGLSPRWEPTLPGRALADLGDALRMFEIHDDQCGVLMFVGDAFASASVVSHPADYRRLHRTLLEDFYGEVLYYRGFYNRHVPAWSVAFDGSDVHSLDDLARCLERARAAWGAFDAEQASGLLGRTVAAERCRTAGPYTLYRFLTGLQPDRDQHIGEVMTHRDGTMAYLKTYRLANAQVERARLLEHLAAHDWHLARAADRWGCTEDQLRRRLISAGFDALLR